MTHTTKDGEGQGFSLNDSPEEIWLEPQCAGEQYEGRCWCTRPDGERCEECGAPWVKYLRADLAPPRRAA